MLSVSGLLAFCAFAAQLAGCRSVDRRSPAFSLHSSGEPEKKQVLSQGRWLGFAKLPSGLKASLILDVALEGDKQRAVLRMLRGDFMSREYSGVYFPEVRSDDAAQTLWRPGYPVMTEIGIRGEFLEGQLVIDQERSLPVRMRRLANPWEGSLEALTIWPEIPVTPSLSGTWTAECGGDQKSLQLESARMSTWRDPSLTERFSGRIGSEKGCGDAGCLESVVRGGFKNIFESSIALTGIGVNESCSVAAATLTCGSCNWSQQTLWTDRDLNPPDDYALVVSPETSGASLQSIPDGLHQGELVHSLTGWRQRLSVRAEHDSEGRTVVVAMLGLGAHGDEAAGYRFLASRPAPGQPWVLDGEGEVFAVIDATSTENKQTVMRGKWYSKTWGLVGAFQVGGSPRGDERNLLPSLTGIWSGPGWDFELAASPGVSSAEDATWPLKVIGWAKEKVPGAKRRLIRGVSWDLWSGTFVMQIDDGTQVTGHATPRGLELWWPPANTPGAGFAPQKTSLWTRAREQAAVSIRSSLDIDVN